MGKHKRTLIQALATFISNVHLTNFLKGTLYQGSLKKGCVPGLNCYSCPGATGACPIGSYQAVAGSGKFKISYYILGLLIFMGVVLGRFICGFLCPFGWFQDLLHKIPGRKFSTKKVHFLVYLKYILLAVFVFLLPALVTNKLGMGDPFFCKFICPQGIMEGALPLSLASANIRHTLGKLFLFKGTILLVIVLLSVFLYRPFCKWLCPLGAFYALFNRISLFSYHVDENKCISCGQCAKICKMDVDITKNSGHTECIRCGECITCCSVKAISTKWGFRS